MIEGRGIKIILMELLILPISFIFKYLLLIFIPMIILTLLFFRDPERVIQSGVVSPADGKIDYIDGNRMEIFMRIFDCHVNRAPVNGVVKRIVYKRGLKVPAFIRKEGVERNEIYIENRDGTFKIVQMAGFIARRIVCYVKEGDFVKKGERIGMITFGSRVVLEIPRGYLFVRRVGEKVKAGETVALKYEDIQRT